MKHNFSLILAFFLTFLSFSYQTQNLIAEEIKDTSSDAQEMGPEEETIIRSVEILGSTIFTQEQLNASVAKFIGLEATGDNLLSLRSSITKIYLENGFSSTAAFLIPEQDISQGHIIIQVVEGKIENVIVQGLQRLRKGYLLQRLPSINRVPFNENQLYKELQILALDPLIATIHAELAPGGADGLSILQLSVEEKDTFKVGVLLNNGRSPAIGAFQRVAQISEASLFGGGEFLSLTYQNTDGSNGVDIRAALPVNPMNGSVVAGYSYQWSELIEKPVNLLDIQTQAQYYFVGFRQPVIKTPRQELSLGLQFDRLESSSFFNGEPFRIAPGQDEFGRSRISALRFSQDYLARSFNQVLAISSSFNFGVEVFSITQGLEPDSQFFSWQLQTYYSRLLAADLSLILKTSFQIADQPLVPDEQFRLGGIDSVRGYRQDLNISDNGFFGSLELRLPVLRIPKVNGVLQVAPFVEGGRAWNNGDRFPPITSGLASVGVGLVYGMGDLGLAGDFSASVYYGVPLIRVEGVENYGNAVYFSIIWQGL